MKLRFVKGHCGWDALTLLPAGQVPAERELDVALRIIDAPMNGGLEVGYVERGSAPDEVRMRVVSSTPRNWTPMCGGMTQVIGKALVESSLRELLDGSVDNGTRVVRLLTDSGTIPIEIETDRGVVRRVTTTMDSYAAYLYSLGVAPITLNGVEALDLGAFLVLDLQRLEQRFPGVDFTRRDPGEHVGLIDELLRIWRHRRGLRGGVYGMMFDERPEGPGAFRVFPRFYSDDRSAATVPWEFQCGTGTVAVGVALAHGGRFAGRKSVLLEWGSQRATPDPYGIRTSQLDVAVEGNKLTAARFSHSVIEILAEGTLQLPGYR